MTGARPAIVRDPEHWASVRDAGDAESELRGEAARDVVYRLERPTN